MKKKLREVVVCPKYNTFHHPENPLGTLCRERGSHYAAREIAAPRPAARRKESKP